MEKALRGYRKRKIENGIICAKVFCGKEVLSVTDGFFGDYYCPEHAHIAASNREKYKIAPQPSLHTWY